MTFRSKFTLVLLFQVFLESRSERETSVRMLTDEVSQIQEVSVCQRLTHHATVQPHTHTHTLFVE